ncbi:MAG: hypothetical protein AB1791_11560 [Chloroflexota bacterium]
MSTEVSNQAHSAPAPQELISPEWVYPYSAGLTGGLLGGAVMALVGIVYGLISGIGVWRPVNLVAATLMRDLQTAPMESVSQFNLAALVVGLVLHLGVSIGLGVVFSFILPALPGRPLYWSWLIGPLLWVGASVAVLPFLNPVMYAHVEWISFILANVLYGLVLGWWIDRTPRVHTQAVDSGQEAQ